jgi:hypothetical protein
VETMVSQWYYELFVPKLIVLQATMERLVLENIRSALFDGKLLTQVHEQLVKS